jgi:TolB protein
MKIICILDLMCLMAPAIAQKNCYGVFSNSADVGNRAIKCVIGYNKKTSAYTTSGGGYNIWFNRDEFHYTYKKLKVDFIVTAHFKLQGTAKERHRKIGWMVRGSPR